MWVQGGNTNLVESKVAALEAGHTAKCGLWLVAATRHLLPCLVLVPLLACSLPPDQAVDLSDSLPFVNGTRVHTALEQGVHVEFAAAAGTMAQELEDTFQPTHELIEKAVVVKVDFVDELVEVVLVTRT